MLKDVNIGRRDECVVVVFRVFSVQRGLSVYINFQQFETEQDVDTLRLYEGIGAERRLTGPNLHSHITQIKFIPAPHCRVD